MIEFHKNNFINSSILRFKVPVKNFINDLLNIFQNNLEYLQD